MDFRVDDHPFLSKGKKCAGRLYLPAEKKHSESWPVVVMAHGLGAELSFRLPAYAEYFVKQGLASFLFDYRYFGGSEGEPRHLVNPFKQRNDWKAALSYVRQLDGIDSERIGLFGTSMSGGHVIYVAAEDKKIKCLVSQVPFVDPFSSMRMGGLQQTLKSSCLAARDLLRLFSFRSPLYVPVIAEPGTFAFMNTPDSFEGYSRLLPNDTDWENKICARFGFIIPAYRPMRAAPGVDCPALMVIAEQDSLISCAAARQTAQRIKDCQCEVWPMGHFEVYVDEWFEKAVALQARFFKQHLG